jgi:hypothetical protein
MTQRNPKPADENIRTAYEVTNSLLANESQLIWTRTTLFIAISALLVQIIPSIPSTIAIIKLFIPSFGLIYSAISFYSLNRMWHYHDAYIALMQEQEEELGLTNLGPMSRVENAAHGVTTIINKKDRAFKLITSVFRARVIAAINMLIFIAIYLYQIYDYFTP